MRAVLDVNVIISALLSPGGAPAGVFRLWLEGAFELVCSPTLLAELERALAYPKLRARIDADDVATLLDVIRGGARLLDDPAEPPPIRPGDPDDDYLVALAASARAFLVTGDRGLLELAGDLPVLAPQEFLTRIEQA